MRSTLFILTTFQRRGEFERLIWIKLDIPNSVGRSAKDVSDASFASVEDLHVTVLTSGEDEVSCRRMNLHAVDSPFVLAVMKIVLRFGCSV